MECRQVGRVTVSAAKSFGSDGDRPTALAIHSRNFTGLAIENNTHRWQREPTDDRVQKIRGFALLSVGPVVVSSFLKLQPDPFRPSIPRAQILVRPPS